MSNAAAANHRAANSGKRRRAGLPADTEFKTGHLLRIVDLYGDITPKRQKFRVGLEEGRLPNNNAIEDGSVPDEHHACFVGVCRAKDRVILTRMQRYRRFPRNPSRFLAEMGLDA